MIDMCLNVLLILLFVFGVIAILFAISVPICFVGYIIEEIKDNDEGIFHKIAETVGYL